MSHLSADAKHAILLEYQPNSINHNFTALAHRHGILGGRDVIRRWHDRWDGTPQSLERRIGSGKQRILTPREVQQHIRAPILEANRSATAIHYPQIQQQIQHETGKNPSLRTIQDYGKKELKARVKHTKKRTRDELSSSLCNEIAECRRKLRKVPDGHLIFLDETAVRVSEAPTNTIVLPGEQPFVITEDTTSYASRFDMIACCTSKETLPPIIYAPNERRKGIDSDMLINYIRDFLAQAVGALNRYPLTLVIDRSTIHNADRMMQAFHDWGCQELVEIVKMPAMSAKRLSPLDNSIFHDWKERVRRHAPITSDKIRAVMNNEWIHLPPSLLASHYRQCLLRPRQPLLTDCPLPAVHRH